MLCNTGCLLRVSCCLLFVFLVYAACCVLFVVCGLFLYVVRWLLLRAACCWFFVASPLLFAEC